MPPPSKRKKQTRNAREKIDCSKLGPKAAFLGVLDDSPLKLPSLPRAETDICSSSNASNNRKRERSTKLDESPPSSSAGKGRPKKALKDLSFRSRISRIMTEFHPSTTIIKAERWFGVEFQVSNPDLYLFQVQLNVEDLSLLVSFRSQLLPISKQRKDPCLSLPELDEYLKFLSKSKMCPGSIAKNEYLAGREIFVTDGRLQRKCPTQKTIQTIGIVHAESQLRLEYHSIVCDGIVESGGMCSSCQQLRAAISSKTEIIFNIANEGQYSMWKRFTNYDISDPRMKSWTPFLQAYFKGILNRKSSRGKWPSSILAFAVTMFTRLGTNRYEELRRHFPLPGVSTVRKICSQIPAGPGINKQAIASFIEREPSAAIAISFDEIYFSHGMQVIRGKDGSFHLVGMTNYGDWDKKVDRYFFDEIEPIYIADEMRDVVVDLAEEELPSGEDQINFVESAAFSDWHEGIPWCTDLEVEEVLSETSQLEAKMALHFMISSVSSNNTQAIGYIETSSMNARLLKCLLFRIISIVAEISSQLPPQPSSSDSLQQFPALIDRPDALMRSWIEYRQFTDEWAIDTVPFPCLDPHNSSLPPAQPLPEWFRTPYQSAEGKVVSISFDGSSHARSMVRKITASHYDARYFIHPSQPSQKIFCIGDTVHIFKRFRNNILKNKILLSPNMEDLAGFPDPRSTPHVYTATLNPHLYHELVKMDETAILAISPLTKAAIDLTSRTKMSFPLARNLFHPRTLLTLDALEIHLKERNDLSGAYLAYSAKGVATWANRFLCRTRSRWVLDGEFRTGAALQLYHLYLSFNEWGRRNSNFLRLVSQLDPNIALPTARSRSSIYGFFDENFRFDLRMTLVGLATLTLTVPQICLRLITSDCVESFFSTIRASVGGGGQLNCKSHRFSTRRAMLVRLNLPSYLGDMIDRQQPLLDKLFAKPADISAPPPTVQLITPTARIVSSPSNREITIIHYVAGWLLRGLMKRFPELADSLKQFIDASVHGLIRTTDIFQNLSIQLFLECHQIFSMNRLLLTNRPDCHQILMDHLLSSKVELINTTLRLTKCSEYLACKVAGLFVVDKSRRTSKIYQKSFRNSL